ncbi:uncharacterized protein LOC62_04G005336 [Vanrija pseudolonga]|uniref:Uncharacterized protein n=1 Tax=Vanrija pseudolonga TaxID=143232 RepID=A0AAF0YE29_9TREE|nr:hypothetical protein LOC62_04G005336 [Vanrija pseudolonga]
MSVTLDHTSYPAIMDLIVAQASPSTLITLRATCRDMNARIRRLMVDAVLHRPTPGGNLALHTRHDGRQLPFLPAYVRTLELAHDVDIGAFTGLHTLCRSGGFTTGTHPAHSVVDFLDVGVFASQSAMRTRVHTHRCVMHFRYDPTSTDDLCLRVMVQHEGVREWVFVLQPSTTATPEWPPAFLLSTLATALWDWDGEKPVSLTVVGGHWSTGKELWADMVHGFTLGRGERPVFIRRPELVFSAIGATRLLTFDAWLEELGFAISSLALRLMCPWKTPFGFAANSKRR